MVLFEKLDEYVEKSTDGTVDVLLLGCVGGRWKSNWKFFLQADFESLLLVLTMSFHDIHCRFKFHNQRSFIVQAL